MAEKNTYKFIGDVGSGGLNTRDDPRALKDNELRYILNMDVLSQGRVVTRFGYDLWASFAGTGGWRMIMPYYRTHGTASGDYLVGVHSNGNAYSMTNSSTTPSSLGAWGTDDGEPARGIVFNNLAIFGNGNAANTPKKWDGTTLASLGGTPPKANNWGIVNKSLIAFDPSTPGIANMSDINNPDAWASGIATSTSVGGLDTGEKTTGVVEANDTPIFFKERSKHIADLSFDTSEVLTKIAFKEKRDSSGGNLAPRSIQSMLNSQGETVYFLSSHGWQAYGSLESFYGVRNPSDLSEKIRPTVNLINYAYSRYANSIRLGNRYECLVPYGSATTNNLNFVFNRDFGAWTIYDNYPFSDICVFRDTKGIDQVYMSSAIEPKIYKRNTGFTDNTFGYSRDIITKTFTQGVRQRWDWVDFEGIKVIGSIIYVYIYIDGVVQSFKIDDNNLMVGVGGGYIGDAITGQAYLGGGYYGSSVPLYRFRGRAKLVGAEGYELYINMKNSNAGEGWGIISYGIQSSPVNNEIPSNTFGDYTYLTPLN